MVNTAHLPGHPHRMRTRPEHVRNHPLTRPQTLPTDLTISVYLFYVFKQLYTVNHLSQCF